MTRSGVRSSSAPPAGYPNRLKSNCFLRQILASHFHPHFSCSCPAKLASTGSRKECLPKGSCRKRYSLQLLCRCFQRERHRQGRLNSQCFSTVLSGDGAKASAACLTVPQLFSVGCGVGKSPLFGHCSQSISRYFPLLQGLARCKPALRQGTPDRRVASSQ
jgi:hypothetical protein